VSTTLFEGSAATFRSVLVMVRLDQLDLPTPCEPLDVGQLIEKAIGHQDWVRGAIHGLAAAPQYPAIEASDYLLEFDRSTAAMVSELESEGAMTRTVTLAAGLQFSGADVMFLASRNIFQYAWDLARGAGRSSDLEPGVAEELLALSKTRFEPPRGPAGFFGPVFTPPAGASTADVLAGFLGRTF
jgi:uncharacterized protein (TIGR03086 family)